MIIFVTKRKIILGKIINTIYSNHMALKAGS